MTFTEREKIILFLRNAEENFPVADWKIDGLEIWPIVKINIFFCTYIQEKIQPKNNLKKNLIFFIKFIKLDVLYSLFWLKVTKIKRINFLFSGFFGHRVMFEGSFFNRYFDPIMDSLEETQGIKSSIFEYEKIKKQKHYRPDRVIDVTKFIHYYRFKIRKVNVDFEKFERFNELLKNFENEIGISSSTILERIFEELNNVFVWRELWRKVLKVSEAQKVIVLCYYNSKMYGLLLAAREQNILSVDVQHGGQGDFNTAYNFISVPKTGYKLLPDFFWTWDKSSANNISKFTQNSSHDVIVGGNPWIDFLKNKSIQLDHKKIILYTLQTNQIPVLHSYIIDGIQNSSDDYTWWLRLHPRMTESEMTELYKQLKDANISHKVEIEKATNLPLPLILANCTAHMSHFSGSILEADLMRVKVNIVIGEVGKKFFKEILEKQDAKYYDINLGENLYEFLEKCIKSSSILQKGDSNEMSYLEAINLISNEKSFN